MQLDEGLRVPFQVKWKSVNRLHTLIRYRLYVVYVNTLHEIRYLHLFITITKINFLIYIIYLFTRPKDWEKECQKWAKIWLPSRFYELLHSQRCIFFIFFTEMQRTLYGSKRIPAFSFFSSIFWIIYFWLFLFKVLFKNCRSIAVKNNKKRIRHC